MWLWDSLIIKVNYKQKKLPHVGSFFDELMSIIYVITENQETDRDDEDDCL
jgi:hypothetical protein